MDAPDTISHLIAALLELRARAIGLERLREADVQAAAPASRDSARNLLHYLSLRQQDLRGIQEELACLGLSSLGRLEAHALATVDAVLALLHRLEGREWQPSPPVSVPDVRAGRRLLADHAASLLGPAPARRGVRIMVTMPGEAAEDAALVRDLLRAGMDVMRINCAHDAPAAWAAMVRNLRDAEREVGRGCRVLADLAGPKLRTGELPGGARVLKLRPRRDARGIVETPARIWLHAPEAAPEPGLRLPALPVAGLDLSGVRVGDRLELDDARGRHRACRIVAERDALRLAEIDRTVYFEQGASLRVTRAGAVWGEGRVGPLPPVPPAIRLKPGDTLMLVPPGTPGRLPERDADGRTLAPGRIPCTLGAVFQHAKVGQRVGFDDGKIGGVILAVAPEEIEVRITHAVPAGARLRADKGINLPDTALPLPALTDKDVADLEFMVAHADMLGLSFVRRPADLLALESHLERLGASSLGIVLKIENREAFENLPRLLLAGLRSPPVGVMVARGDLAVEVGFERLAELQEEILWLSEAAHVPVVWATQVLDTLARKGAASRAEVTDAAMSGRAECVMLNKGPHVVQAVEFLSTVLERMAEHQVKKRTLLRRLSVSHVG